MKRQEEEQENNNQQQYNKTQSSAESQRNQIRQNSKSQQSNQQIKIASQNSIGSKSKLKRDSSSQLQSRNTQRESQQNLEYANVQKEQPAQTQFLGEGRLGEYGEEEENLICIRFPHLSFCACEIQCQQAIKEVNLVEIFPNIFLGPYHHGLCTKKLLQKGITNILNVTSQEYKKRTKYFKYLNIDVQNKSDEDIKKHFRITNRFIQECLDQNGKIFIHDIDGINIGPCFVLAYLINNQKIPLKQGNGIFSSKQKLQISPNFYKQLERYDLEKLAIVTVKKKNE